MIKLIKGNLFENLDKNIIIAHGCNCRGGYGAGFVVPLAERYPVAREYYLKRHEVKGWSLGFAQILPVENKNNIYVANCATQDRFWKKHRTEVLVNYKAVADSLAVVAKFAREQKLKVYMPAIGAGLAGGNWSKLKSIIEKCMDGVECHIYILPHEWSKYGE